MAKKQMWVCSDCGSTKVQTKMWMNLNTNKPVSEVSDGDSDDNWCEGCESHTDVELKAVETKKFILGYKDPGEATVDGSNLTLYKSKKEADFDSEEWVEVEAVDEEQARANYEQARYDWLLEHNKKYNSKS